MKYLLDKQGCSLSLSLSLSLCETKTVPQFPLRFASRDNRNSRLSNVDRLIHRLNRNPRVARSLTQWTVSKKFSTGVGVTVVFVTGVARGKHCSRSALRDSRPLCAWNKTGRIVRLRNRTKKKKKDKKGGKKKKERKKRNEKKKRALIRTIPMKFSSEQTLYIVLRRTPNWLLRILDTLEKTLCIFYCEPRAYLPPADIHVGPFRPIA